MMSEAFMRVGIVTPWFPTRANANSGVFVLKDAQALSESGVDIGVIHLVPPHEDDGTRRTVVEGIKTIRVPMSTSNPLDILRARVALDPLMRRFDVIHTHAISGIEPFVFRRPKQFWVHTEHWSGLTNPETLPYSWQKVRPLLLRMLRLPDVALGECEYLASHIRELRGDKPVEMIYCQVESPKKIAAKRAPDGEIRLVSTGGLVERKDPILAIEVLSELQKRGVNSSLTWLGTGPLLEEAQVLASELGVKACFPGLVSGQGVQIALANADMFIGTTRGENFYIAAAEAIVNGRPLVVGSRGGQKEYIDQRIGRVIEERDPAVWAEAVIQLFDDTIEWTAEEIAATVGDSFEPSTIAAQYIRLYERGLR
ncbi:glycosyltransferase [Actinomyces sp.]|uniref:glycosyltransferase family 4 protein n=1 Tax=Actinomyces sp. TaxID=29317 RepID=UPI00290A3428|nr:glycosyltransferase [Actinomyces sp.]MDU6678717.1 glycosyltransferase [Actinomyces sp.]